MSNEHTRQQQPVHVCVCVCVIEVRRVCLFTHVCAHLHFGTSRTKAGVNPALQKQITKN